MKETASILKVYNGALKRKQKMVLVSVVEVKGSSYRAPGAHLLLVEDGSRAGSISAGCLEKDIIARGDELFSLKEPQTITYENPGGSDLFGLGLGCEGTVTLLLEPVSPESVSACCLEATVNEAPPDHSARTRLSNSKPTLNYPEAAALVERTAKPAILATIIESADRELIGARVLYSSEKNGSAVPPKIEALIRSSLPEVSLAGRHQIRYYDQPGLKVLFEVIKPSPRLIVFGTGDDTTPLLEIAHVLGLHTTLVDTRPHKQGRNHTHARVCRLDCAPVLDGRGMKEFSSRVYKLINAPDHSAVLIMSHNYELDKHFLSAAIAALPSYLGVMGPARRTRRMLSELGIVGDSIKGLHFPIGLDLGGENPEEVALSILSEVVSHFRGGSARPLSALDAPIHRRAEPYGNSGLSDESASRFNKHLYFKAGNTNA